MGAAVKEAETAQQTVVIQPLDDIARYVHANAGIDLDTMPSTYEESGQFALPIVDDKKRRKLQLGYGRTKEVVADIGWINREKFTYAWLDIATASKPQFKGYRPVTKDCPAAVAAGKPIPESYYGGKSYISVGEAILHYAKASFAQGVKEASRSRALNKLSAFKPGGHSVTVGDEETGMDAGGVITKDFKHQGFEED